MVGAAALPIKIYIVHRKYKKSVWQHFSRHIWQHSEIIRPNTLILYFTAYLIHYLVMVHLLRVSNFYFLFLLKPHSHYAIFLRLRLRFGIAIARKSHVSFTLLQLHFASKCDFFQFQSQKLHIRSIRLIYIMQFSCDCDSKSLRLNLIYTIRFSCDCDLESQSQENRIV